MKGDCPWDTVAECRCASEGVEVIATSDAAIPQLCRSDIPVARPMLPSDPITAEVCIEERLGCRDGVVRSCDRAGAPVRAIATCLFGCTPALDLEQLQAGSSINLDGAVMILCLRDHAERR